MANRKKHLKYQARKHPSSLGDSEYRQLPSKPSRTDDIKPVNADNQSELNSSISKSSNNQKSSNPAKTPKEIKKEKSNKTEIFTQLPDQEVEIVKLELRHILFTGSLILILFLGLWLLAHFTQLDEKLYSSLHIVVQSK